MKKIDYKTAYDNVMIENNLLKSNMATMQDELNKLFRDNQRLKEVEEDHKQTNATLMSELAKLEEENERLKEWKEDLLKENIELENIRKEAIEYLDKVETLAMLDGKIIFSINIFKNILQNGSEKDG